MLGIDDKVLDAACQWLEDKNEADCLSESTIIWEIERQFAVTKTTARVMYAHWSGISPFQSLLDQVRKFKLGNCPGVYSTTFTVNDFGYLYGVHLHMRSGHDKGQRFSFTADSPEKALETALAHLTKLYSPCPACDGTGLEHKKCADAD